MSRKNAHGQYLGGWRRALEFGYFFLRAVVDRTWCQLAHRRLHTIRPVTLPYGPDTMRWCPRCGTWA